MSYFVNSIKSTKNKRVLVNFKLSRDEKLKICSQNNAKSKKEESRQKLNDILEDWDFDVHGKITQRKIYNNFKLQYSLLNISKKNNFNFYILLIIILFINISFCI